MAELASRDSIEMDTIYMTDLFQRMVASCHTKCIAPKHTDSELTKGEAVCIDRCVAKFNEVHEMVSYKLRDNAAAAGVPGQQS
eukprot:m.334090 g.334090  ORF g.334090 m.334090 type:complete len:83 (-) comp17285_c0_seq1:148-396(-)